MVGVRRSGGDSGGCRVVDEEVEVRLQEEESSASEAAPEAGDRARIRDAWAERCRARIVCVMRSSEKGRCCDKGEGVE